MRVLVDLRAWGKRESERMRERGRERERNGMEGVGWGGRERQKERKRERERLTKAPIELKCATLSKMKCAPGASRCASTSPS